MPDRRIKRHDTHVQPRARLLNEFGAGIDLTGLDVVYSLKNLRTNALKIDRAAAILADQTVYPGEVAYQFLAADVDTSGIYAEEWEVTYGDGTTESFPTGRQQRVIIEDDEDNT